MRFTIAQGAGDLELDGGDQEGLDGERARFDVGGPIGSGPQPGDAAFAATALAVKDELRDGTVGKRADQLGLGRE